VIPRGTGGAQMTTKEILDNNQTAAPAPVNYDPSISQDAAEGQALPEQQVPQQQPQSEPQELPAE
jgi:hypothetical protein